MDKKINQNEYEKIKNEILHNFKHYSIIVFSKKIEMKSLKLIDKYSLKPLDSIQLASALAVKNEIESFVGCDEKLNNACKKENIKVFDPVKN